MQEAVQADTFVAKFTMPTEMQQGLQSAGNDNATTMVLDGLKLAQQTCGCSAGSLMTTPSNCQPRITQIPCS